VASLHERLFSRIDVLHDDTVSLIQELVRVNSITPTLPGSSGPTSWAARRA
jgi:hypothetical protein